MVISQPQGIILHIIIVLHQRCLERRCLETPYVLYMQLQHQVTHRNGTVKHILFESDPRRGSSADCSLFILSLHALALHLAVKILLPNLSVSLSTLAIHLSVVFPSRIPAGPHFVTQPILLSENIPNI